MKKRSGKTKLTLRQLQVTERRKWKTEKEGGRKESKHASNEARKPSAENAMKAEQARSQTKG